MSSNEAALLKKRLSDRLWRLNSLYYIIDKAGKRVKFQMNSAQERLYNEMHLLNVILKARQRGFTTFIQLFMLDTCLFNSNTSCGTIAHTLTDAQHIFATKVKYPYNNLPEGLRNEIGADQDSANSYLFSNNSGLRVGTSLRSGTLQMLHVSEHGKLCARYPDKAEEVRTGALNTVDIGQMVFVESTAEGQGGDYYDLCMESMNHQREGRTLTELDFKFHFHPWYEDEGYVLNTDHAILSPEDHEYFNQLAIHHGIELTPEQRAWYVYKKKTQKDAMKREYPSTPEEAFEAAIEGAYFSHEMTALREAGHITDVPYDPHYEVNTFWDVGTSDMTCIWFHQHIGYEHRFFDYFQDNHQGLKHYAKVLKDKDYNYGHHYFPHDMGNLSLSTGKTREDTANELGISPSTVVPRTLDINDDIEEVRNVLPNCWFHREKCMQGTKGLDAFRKDWDDKNGRWKDKPLHDWASDPVAAFRTFAMGFVNHTSSHSSQVRNNSNNYETGDQDYDILNR